jgi:hypothetical protein
MAKPENPLTDLGSDIKASCLTGSHYICDPPVTDTDRDIAVLVHSLPEFGDNLEQNGWAVTYDDPEYTIERNNELPFITARKGVLNLIVFDSYAGFDAFAAATAVAKHLNLLKKEDRVMLFQAVCGGRSVPEVEDFS